jgi:ketosteroid isomerase-like protein
MNRLLKISFTCILISSWCITTLQSQPKDGIMTEYPEEKAELLQIWDEIVESVKTGDIDKLISFHAYGPKFTEFKQGEPRNGGEENEAFERGVFGSVQEVLKMDANELKVSVYYGNLAVVTFHSDFHLQFEEEMAVVNDQISLVFVKNSSGDWKIVHEHHSPLNME